MARDLVYSFGIGAALSGSFGATVGSAKKQVSSLGATIKNLESRRVNLDTFKNLKLGIRDTEKELASAQARVNQLAGEMRRAEKPTAAMRREFNQAKQQAQQLSGKLNRQQGELVTLRGRMQAAGQSTRNWKQQQVQLGAAIERTTRAQQKLNSIAAKQSALQSRRADLRGQMLGTAGIAVAVAAPIKAAISFEEKMADIKKVVDFDSPAAFKQMGADIVALTMPGKGAIPMAASGIADIVAAAGQSGIAQKELLGFAESAAKMGVAFDLTGEESGAMMANWRAGMNLTQQRAVSLADAVNYLSNNMNAQAGALGEVLQRQGAVAMSAGLTETQAASLGAALLSSGTGPEVAATAMKNLTGALTKGGAATKKQIRAFDALGFSAEDMAAKMQQDARGTIIEVFQALQQAPKEEQSALVSQLFGEESKGAIMPLLANLDNLNKAFGLTSNATKYAGSMQREYEERSKTTANSLQLLGNAVTGVGVNLGTVLLPGLNAVFNVIGPVIGAFATLAAKCPLLTSVIGGLVIGLVALKIATLAGGYAWTFLYGGVLSAQKAFVLGRLAIFGSTTALQGNAAAVTILKGRTIALAIAQKVFAAGSAIATGALSLLSTGFSILGAAIMATPIGWIIGGIALLVGAAVLVYKYWEPIKNFFAGLNLFENGARIIGTLVDGIKSMALAPFNAVKNVLGKVRKLLPFSDAKEGPLSQLTLSGKSIMDTIGAGVRTGAPGLRDTMSASLPRSGALAAGPRSGGGGQSITIHISPKITIAPGMNTDQVRSAVDSSMQFSEQRLREAVERLFAQNRRLSFA